MFAVARTAAAEPDAGTVADSVDRTGFYVEPGAEADADAVDDTAADLANEGLFPGLVVLAEDPPGGSTAYATEVFDELVAGNSEVRTVVVVSPETVGVDGDEYDGDIVDGALDASIDAFQSSPAEGFAAFYDQLSGEPQGGGGTASASTDEGGGGGGGFGVVLLVILVAVVAIGGFLWWRSRKRAGSSDRAILDEARSELKAQLSVVADRILATEARASTASTELQTRFAEASATYSAALEAIDRAATPGELRDLSNRLDRARWQIAAVEAELDGQPIPPEPTAERRAACFFDPNHASATEEAELRSAAGTRKVGVCAECAEKLRRGEQPRPRDIQVGGQRVPAPQAPTEVGGGGLGGLLKGGIFEIVLGGLAGAAGSFDWGRREPAAPPRRRRSGGQWGSVADDPWGVGPYGDGGRRAEPRRSEPRRSDPSEPSPSQPSPAPGPGRARGPRVRRGRRL